MTPDPTTLTTPADLALWWRGVAADHREIVARCGHDKGQLARSKIYIQLYEQMALQLELVLQGKPPLQMDPSL